ncbi:MAG: hypothetical protein JXA37_12705 [Chloroflexia bacterium]|nr:hypothetical protein [Chloroflexia bacterium]
MKQRQWILVIGILLIASGVLFLLGELNWLSFLGTLIPLFWGGIFVVGATLFLNVFLRDREQWWAIIPAGVLASLGATILTSQIPFLDTFSGFVFLGGMGATFLIVYLFNRQHWWALIPGGILALLAGVVLVGEIPWIGGALQGTMFLAGLGLGFLLLYFFRREHWWAIIPGGVLLVLSLLPPASEIGWLNNLIPLILFVGIGAVFFALYSVTQMRWALWVALGTAGFGLLIQLASSPAALSSSLFALLLILGGGYMLLRGRQRD